MQLLVTLTTLFATVIANDWTLYCGSSCSNGIAIASGSNYEGAPCTDFGTTYEYCYMVADEPYYKAVVLEGKDCAVTSEDIETSIFNGECTSIGTWSSYIVAVNL